MGITKPPEDSVGFTVIVIPASIFLACWKFVILLSKDDASRSEQLISDICRSFLSEHDQFSIHHFNMDEEDESLEGFGVLSYYSEHPDCFDWITVPPHMRN